MYRWGRHATPRPRHHRVRGLWAWARRSRERPAAAHMSATLVVNDPDRTEARTEPGSEAAAKRRLDDQFLRAQRLESIGMLASGIAHDLNNVLAPIILAAPELREHATHPDDLRIIASLEKSAERGVALVRQILAFAQGVGGGRQLVDVRHLLRETVNVIRETFPKNIRLEDSVPTNLVPIMADPTQIHQVI